MLLWELIARSAERFPDKPALLFPNESISFGELDRRSNQVAARLANLGIGPGDRVAILYENALAAVVFFWGILKSGAQSVDIPSLAGMESVVNILAECQPRAIVISERQLARAKEFGSALPPMVFTAQAVPTTVNGATYHSLGEIVTTETDAVPPRRTREHDVAMIVYTSGTTGEPKGVMLSHRNLLSNISAANSWVKLDSDDSILVVVPLHFIHGRMQLLMHAMIGGTMAFSAGFHFPQQVVEDLARYEVTGFSGVPYHFSTLLELTNLKKRSLPKLRYVLVTGGAMAPERIRELSDALPGVAIHLAYGQTEASPRITYVGPGEWRDRPGSAGRALPGVRVEIVDEDGAEVEGGSIGEIVASGPNIMCGYVSGDETTTGKIDAFGRLHTGDIGRLNDDGHLYVVGRKSELIKSAGERVFPREVETVLDSYPPILESAVLGIPDTLLGERIVACVVLQPGAVIRPEEVRMHCLKFLPMVRVPREIRVAEHLPKTASGKIDRGNLPAHFRATAAAEGKQ
jgi:acyl-CoA synthetase (AMP-forming)/AMP-acid ligase II